MDIMDLEVFLLGRDYPSGAVRFSVDGRTLQARLQTAVETMFPDPKWMKIDENELQMDENRCVTHVF